MRLVKMQCKNCGATFTVEEGCESAICEYCGATVTLPKKSAKITIQRTKLNGKPFVVFGVIATFLILVASLIVFSVINGNKTDPRAFKAAGVYLVGEDIPSGEYVLYPNVNGQDVVPVLEVRKTKEAAIDKEDFLYRKEFYMRQYVNLNDGEYLAFENALLYLPEKVKLKPLGENGYAAAQLKVGADIAAGEYVIVGDNKQAQYYITSKPEAELYGTSAINSPDMLSFGYCENRIYLKVKEGEYLSFAGGRLYNVGEAPAPVKSNDGALPPGQYKVGVDIQSGKYIVSPTENKRSQAWVCLNKNAVKTGSLSSWDVQNKYVGGETLIFMRLENFEESCEITVPDPGEDELYITFCYCIATPH